MPVSGNVPAGDRQYVGLVVKLTHLPEDATHQELESALCAVLHKPSQEPDKRVNFKLDMKLHYSSMRNVGYAHVIFPDEKWSSVLKKEGLKLRRRSIRVEYAQCQPPHRSTILFLRRTAYDDGQSVRLLDLKREQLDGEIHLDEFALGIVLLQRGASAEQPQPVFATEWSIKGHRSTLQFEDNLEESHRGFRVSYGDHSDPERRSIVVRAVTVTSVTFGHDCGSPFMVFCLSCPPAYESNRNAVNVPGGRRGPYNVRDRRVSVDERHELVAPYAFQLLVRPQDGFEVLVRKATIAGLPAPRDADRMRGSAFEFETKGYYSPDNLHRLRQWLVRLDIRVAFQIQALVSNVVIDPVTVLQRLRRPIDDVLTSHTPEEASGILREFRRTVQQKLQPGFLAADVDLLQHLLKSAATAYLEQAARMREVLDPNRRRKGDSVVFCHHVTITPTGARLDGPNPIKANRVLRQYDTKLQYFLRVKFTDEDFAGQFRWHRGVDGHQFVAQRVGGILKRGLELAGRDFRFLGYSLSALHTYSAWFITDFYAGAASPDGGNCQSNVCITPEYIRASLGDFSEVMNCPSLFGARMALAFSATDSTVLLDPSEIEQIPDIYSEDGNLMTDGCSPISPELGVEMNAYLFRNKARIAEWEDVVNVYQFRQGGAKGVVFVDSSLAGRRVMRLRPSQIKFPAFQSLTVEVANYARPSRMYLNRPLIMTLETLGVRCKAFMRLQEHVLRDSHAAATSIRDFIPILGKLGTQYSLRYVLEQLTDLQCGFRDDCSENDGIVLDDIFFTEMVQSVLWEILRSIKYNARIAVPESWTLLGLADNDNILQEGQVMAYIVDDEYKNGKWLEGPALICRSPVMHPGDVQMVTAISPPQGSAPAKNPLVNSIVFSTQGQRSLATCLAAGDFDGDSYHISQHEPLFITHPHLPAPAAEGAADRHRIEGRDGTIDDVADFFVDYINSDTVGLLARQHLIIADQSWKGVKSPKCLDLAAMYSRAVDFPKTGKPVDTEDMPRLDFSAKPDWISNEGEEEESGGVYKSDKALGALYRAVLETKIEDVAVLPPSQGPTAVEESITSALEPRVELFTRPDAAVPADMQHAIDSLYKFYIHEMRRISGLYTINSKAPLKEMEIMLGTILARSSQPKKRKQLAALMHVHTGWLADLVTGQLLQGLDVAPDACLFKAWAAWRYICALRPVEHLKELRKPFGSRSFGILALAAVFRALDKLQMQP